MSENSDTKKRKSTDQVHPEVADANANSKKKEQKKTLFVLEYNPLVYPFEQTKYALFTCGKNTDVYERLCKAFLDDMKSAARGWEHVCDAQRTWVPWMMFLIYKSKFTQSPNSGYDDEEDYQKSRNQKARQVMLPIGMIRTTEEFNSDEVGKDFVKEEIGEFKLITKQEVMELGDFNSVMIVPSHCNQECDKYYKKL